ncbi:MAG: DUF2807 domain-containing protein [Bacteroidales bacterium]
MKTLFNKLSGLLILLIALVSTLNVYAQDNTAKFSEVTIDKKFNALEVNSVYKVFLQQGTTQMVRFESSEDITGKIWADVEGSTLTFGSKGIDPKRVNIYVIFTGIERIETNGAATVIGQSVISGERFELESSGASKVELQLEVKNLYTEITGASETKLSGKADYHRTEVSGAATLKAWDLITSKANVEVSGAAQAKLNVTDEVKGETSGIGKINLKQEPKVKNIEKSGISHVYTGTDSVTEEGVTQINLGGSKIMTIDENGIIVESDSSSVEPIVINDDGVKVILKEKSKDGKKETKVLVINEDGVKVVKKHSKDDGHKDFWSNKKSGKFDGHWAGFDLGVNGYVNKDGNMDLPKEYNFLDLRMEKSINVKVNFFEQNFNLIRNHVGLVTGLGLEYNNYRFASNVILEKNNDVLEGYYDEDPDKVYKKSKLVVNYLNLPLLLEYQTNNKANVNSFHLAAGVTAGLRIGSHTKVVYTSGKENKDKVRDDFYLNPFKWDLTARAGWGVLNLYANYSMTSLFKNKKGPELYPFSVGITLTDF